MDRDFTGARLLLTLDVHGARAIRALIDDLRDRLRSELPADLEWHIAGEARLLADQEQLLIHGQLDSLIAVSVLLTVLMLLMWRSLPLAALSMAPNLAPIVLIFALKELLGIWLDVGTAMIASVAVAIAVDDTIHILHRYLRCRRRGSLVPCAPTRTFRLSRRAVTATTLALVAQFSLLIILPDQRLRSAYSAWPSDGVPVRFAGPASVVDAGLALDRQPGAAHDNGMDRRLASTVQAMSRGAAKRGRPARGQ